MKYLFLGCGILAVLLALCILVSCLLGARTDALCETLGAALLACEGGQYDAAAQRAAQAQTQWLGQLSLFSSFLCHDETDKITETFSELLVCTAPEDALEFRLRCSQLLTMLGHISEMDLPLLHNIL